MIIIRNTQRSVSLNITQIRTQAEKILAIAGYAEYDLGIWFTNDATIRQYNKQYRHKDKTTDILSFAYHQAVKPGRLPRIHNPEEANMGDLIISAPYVQAAAQNLGIPLQEHVQNLLIHGICHLLGYDHETDADFRAMRRKENAILRKLHAQEP